MADEFYGVEIIERFEAGRTVRDVRSAVTYLVGTAPIHLKYLTPQARAPFINTDIIIRRPEDYVAAFGPLDAAPGYSLPRDVQAFIGKDRGVGFGTLIVRNVFDPDVHKTGAVPDPSLVSAADIVGGLDASGKPKGLEAAKYTYGQFGFFPRRIAAGHYSRLAAVRTQMLAMANKVRAHAIADMPIGITVQQALAQRGVGQPYQLGDDRLVYCWPEVMAYDPVTKGHSLQPLSSHFAGIWNELVAQPDSADDDGGVSASPSNRKMPDVTGLELPMYSNPNDPAADIQLLRAAGIVTADMGQWGKGIVTFGNHASSHAPTNSAITRKLHIRTMYDALHEAIQFFLMQYSDRKGTVQRIDVIEDQVQRYLNQKERDGWIYGAQFRFDRAKNTAEEIINDRFYYRIDGAPIGVMERITVEDYVDLSIIRSALGLTN